MGGRPRNFDEAQVLDRAIELFWRDGYTATSMHALLAHMGISRQSLYNVFGDKRRLFLAALDRYIQEKASVSLQDLESPEAGYETVVHFFHRLGEFARTSCGTRKACLVGKTCMELAAEDPEVRSLVQAHFDRTVRAFQNALENAQSRREIEPLNAAAVARHLTATLNGLGIMFRAGVANDDLGEVVGVALSVMHPIKKA